MWCAQDMERPVLPRRFSAGPVMLDLFHRDGLVRGRWLRLHPREFEVLWLLAECAPEPVSHDRLLRDVWRLDFDPETNRVAVAICRIRAKMRAAGLRGLIATIPERGYLLRAGAEALDSLSRLGDDGAFQSMAGEINGVSGKRSDFDRSG